MSNRNIAIAAALAGLVGVGASLLSAQTPQRSMTDKTRTMAVSILDPLNRFVGGMGREQFQIFENGTAIEPMGFQSSEAGAAIAIVGSPVTPELKNALSGQDELTEASSLNEAIKQVRASERRKRAVILVGATGSSPAGTGIQVVQADTASLQRTVLELRNQYVMQFEQTDPSSKIEFRFQQSSLLPVLKAVVKGPY